jgi:hypothetical protein
MNWTMFNGSYLLVGAQLYDRAGNSAWFYDVAGIRTANQPELRFVAGSQRLARAGTSSYYWTVSATVENAGLAASGPVIVGLYQYDPDPGRTGSTTQQPLGQAMLGPLPSGGSATVQLQFSSNTIRTRLVYLMLDTNASMPDMDRGDNVLTVSLPPEAVPKMAASRGFTPGFELAATVAAAAMALVLVRRLRNLRG